FHRRISASRIGGKRGARSAVSHHASAPMRVAGRKQYRPDRSDDRAGPPQKIGGSPGSAGALARKQRKQHQPPAPRPEDAWPPPPPPPSQARKNPSRPRARISPSCSKNRSITEICRKAPSSKAPSSESRKTSRSSMSG